MGGLILLFAVGVWIGFAIWLSIWLYRRTQGPRLKAIVKWCAFPVILLLPLGDEIVGEVQLRYLCSQGGLIHIDEKNGMNAVLTMRQVNTTSKFQYLRIPEKKLKWTVLDINELAFDFYAESVLTPIIQIRSYEMGSGWLSRNTGVELRILSYSGCENHLATLKSSIARLNAKTTNWN